MLRREEKDLDAPLDECSKGALENFSCGLLLMLALPDAGLGEPI
jgi:hypothetical protein